MNSGFVHFAANVKISFSLAKYYSSAHVYHILGCSFTHWRVCRLALYLGYFEQWRNEQRMQISFPYADFIFSTYVPRWTARSYRSTSSFLRNFYTAFYNDCTNFYSHQQCIRVPFSPPAAMVFLITAFLAGVRWCCTVVLACIPSEASDTYFSCTCEPLASFLLLLNSISCYLLLSFLSSFMYSAY